VCGKRLNTSRPGSGVGQPTIVLRSVQFSETKPKPAQSQKKPMCAGCHTSWPRSMVVAWLIQEGRDEPLHDRSRTFTRGIAYARAVNDLARARSHTSVKPQAEANARMLSGGSTVYSKELIRTGEAGVADLRFHDNSNLSVGRKSSVRLDKFVYDPNKSAGGVAVEATRGSFRFVTGSQSKGSYQVKTPYGTLGIRG
jgi:hypothetical protein